MSWPISSQKKKHKKMNIMKEKEQEIAQNTRKKILLVKKDLYLQQQGRISEY